MSSDNNIYIEEKGPDQLYMLDKRISILHQVIEHLILTSEGPGQAQRRCLPLEGVECLCWDDINEYFHGRIPDDDPRARHVPDCPLCLYKALELERIYLMNDLGLIEDPKQEPNAAKAPARLHEDKSDRFKVVERLLSGSGQGAALWEYFAKDDDASSMFLPSSTSSAGPPAGQAGNNIRPLNAAAMARAGMLEKSQQMEWRYVLGAAPIMFTMSAPDRARYLTVVLVREQVGDALVFYKNKNIVRVNESFIEPVSISLKPWDLGRALLCFYATAQKLPLPEMESSLNWNYAIRILAASKLGQNDCVACLPLQIDHGASETEIDRFESRAASAPLEKSLTFNSRNNQCQVTLERIKGQDACRVSIKILSCSTSLEKRIVILRDKNGRILLSKHLEYGEATAKIRGLDRLDWTELYVTSIPRL